MDPSTLLQFESQIQPESLLNNLWNDVRIHMNGNVVQSKEEVYILFSKVLKISNLIEYTEPMKTFWYNLLQQGSFFFHDSDNKSIKYTFDTIIDLIKSGEQAFIVDIIEINSKECDLASVSESIHSICLDSVGDSPGAPFFQEKFASPNVMCLLAKYKETPIACAYGTYRKLSEPKINLFHINFLGRKPEYPSVHMIEIMQEQLPRIRNKFPDLNFLTLCVDVDNEHMISIYQRLGFKQIEFVEKGTRGVPVFFYGKPIDCANSNLQPPNRECSVRQWPTYLQFRNVLN